MSNSQLHLYVTFVPPGEAPAWVREKWVGLKLPLRQRSSQPGRYRGAGVLTSPRGLVAMIKALLGGRIPYHEGYLVDALKAVEILEEVHPEAAAWWRKNTPHLMRPNRRLLFQAGVGHVAK
jgi:hypothetical protein